MQKFSVVCASLLWLAASGWQSARAITITVNSTNDPAGFNSSITVAQLGATVTLRDAINAARNANGLGSEQVITFDASLAGQTITIQQSELLTQRSGVDLNNRFLRFEGLTNSPGVTIAASTTGRIGRLFACLGGTDTSVTFNNLTFRYANNGTNQANWGGGFFIGGTVTFNNCAILNCTAGIGGGIYLTGADSLLTMNNCVVAGNFASYGGGIYQNHGHIVLNHVTIAYNSSAGTAGGLAGTGIFLPQVNNSIIANNIAPLGWTDIQTRLTATSSNNLCSAVPFANGQTFDAGNNAGNMINGVNGNIVGVNPQLGALGNYGGPTPTLPLLDNSPALDAIAATTLPTDQRGIARPQGSAPDMGALEAQHPASAALATNAFTRLVSDPAFDLLAAISPSPAGGTLSGPGISGNNFNPATAGPGVHRVQYRISGQTASPDGITWSTADITITVNELSSLVVTTTNDVVSSFDGVTSLREALAYAATLTNAPTITFSSSLTTSGPATLALTQTGLTNSIGLSAFGITNKIIVQGPTSGYGISLYASGVTNQRHFHVAPGASLALANLTLTGGRTTNFGGSVVSEGALIINGSTFTGNSASGPSSAGGAIYTSLDPSTSLFIQNSTFASNSATAHGGAIHNFARSNTLIHVTVADNTGLSAVRHLDFPITLINTIIARNLNGTTPSDFVTGGAASITPQSTNNLIGTAAASLHLGTLANNGGPSATVAPLLRSPARNGGIVVPGVTNDQTGGPRVNGPAPDIGAYEFPALQESLVVTTATDEDDYTADATYGTGTSLREAVVYASTLTNAPTVTFAPALTASGPASFVLSQTGFVNAYGPSAMGISNTLTIAGAAGSNGITLACSSGGPAGLRHFFVTAGGSLTVSNLTFTGGTTADRGAAIGSSGSLAIYGCSFTGNVSTLEGGAVHALSGAQYLRIHNSTFAGNSAASYGGALVSGANSNLLVHVTMVDNTCGPGGGAYWQHETPVTMINSIIARNYSGSNASDIVTYGSGAFTAQSSNNLIGPGGAANLIHGANGNQVGVPAANLLLGSVGNNGGPTPTVQLLPGSPSANAGAYLPTVPADQRGYLRDNPPDIGAYELLAANSAPRLAALPVQTNAAAAISYGFTNRNGASFTIFGVTNILAPLNLWSNLGPAVETPPGSGQYQFTAPLSTNTPQYFIRVQSP